MPEGPEIRRAADSLEAEGYGRYSGLFTDTDSRTTTEEQS